MQRWARGAGMAVGRQGIRRVALGALLCALGCAQDDKSDTGDPPTGSRDERGAPDGGRTPSENEAAGSRSQDGSNEPASGRPDAAGMPGQDAAPEGDPVADRDATAPDARDAARPATGDAALTDAGVVSHEGLVALFVAFGHGGRTLASCDDGRSFGGEHVFLDDGADHGPYSALGRMAYGKGVFVGAVGWGATGGLVASRDGFAWQELADGAFLDESGAVAQRGSGNTGVAFDGDVFVSVIGGRAFRSSDGFAWRRLPDALPAGSLPQLRSLGGGHGLVLLPFGDELLVSRDQAASWETANGFDVLCVSRLQRQGAIRVRGQRVVIAGRDGYACASADGAQNFSSAVQLTTWLSSFVFADNAELVAIGRPQGGGGTQRTLFRSADGEAWSEAPSALPFNPAVMARSDAGTIVTLNETGSDVRRSTDDARTWSSGTSSSAHAHGLTDLVFGYGEPSGGCPNN